jgi:hypothetical protein
MYSCNLDEDILIAKDMSSDGKTCKKELFTTLNLIYLGNYGSKSLTKG